MRTIIDITEAISTIQGINYAAGERGLEFPYIQVARESDGQIMEIAPYPDDDETAVGCVTFLNHEAIADGDYIDEDAVELNKLEELVTQWANS